MNRRTRNDTYVMGFLNMDSLIEGTHLAIDK